jgi:hypothetical protein
MTQAGVPVLSVNAIVAIVVEFFVALAAVFGAWTPAERNRGRQGSKCGVGILLDLARLYPHFQALYIRH